MVEGNQTVGVCDSCGTQQTLPRLDDDRKANLYDRANYFRRSNDFDKAASIYEQILNEDTTDAEAYWSLVLCRYGIEYVEDPVSHKRIPTVHRMQYTSILADGDYKSAMEYADLSQRGIYEEEARAIDHIQKGILAVSQKEEPFDVFICYKETDENGRRTQDSVDAQELYYELKDQGFKVFFSRITLEDKLGVDYEPYIFAALNSAKVMVVVGSKPEYFEAVWVKNEWSRFLDLIRRGEKKLLIPACKGVNPYDLPDELSHLQSQDMTKLGFVQDLVRGIKKVVRVDEPAPVRQAAAPVAPVAGGNVNALLKRAQLFLEEGDYDSADEKCESVLDIDPENAQAYVYKLLAQLQLRQESDLVRSGEELEHYPAFKNAVRFADPAMKERLQGYSDEVKARMVEARRREEERLAEERRREEERQQKMRAEQAKRDALNRIKNERNNLVNRRTSLQSARNSLIEKKHKLETSMKNAPNPVTVRILGVITLLWQIVTASMYFVAFIAADEYGNPNTGIIVLWVLMCIVYFVLFGILATRMRRAFGLTFVNLPTFGIFGFIYTIINLIRAGSYRGRVMKEIQQVDAKLAKVEEELEVANQKVIEVELRITNFHSTYQG